MVVVQIYGGLGNQMFQYATGRALAGKLSTMLKLDISLFEMYKLHHYSLHSFAIAEHFANANEIAMAKGKALEKTLGQRIYHRLGINNEPAPGHVVQEKSLEYDPDVMKTSAPAYLAGYWQSEKYFCDIRDVLLKELAVRFPPDSMNTAIANEIESANSVSIHVRRGDYVTNTNTNKRHGLCSPEYYQRCVKYLAEKIHNPHFFVFSDDPGWVRQNMQFDYPLTYVDHNDASTNYEDLRLMTKCKHHIIANSSFSWWGAWLSTSSDKIVLAPKEWFQDRALMNVSPVADGWLTM